MSKKTVTIEEPFGNKKFPPSADIQESIQEILKKIPWLFNYLGMLLQYLSRLAFKITFDINIAGVGIS